MLLKPWYDVIKPREDLCEGNVPEASEFAVHLDKVRDGRAIAEYTNPFLFFTRTYLTKNLTNFVSEVIRRLSGESLEANPAFHLVTQFGGGKTHALTLLYHLARHGTNSHKWPGVENILAQAGIPSIPKAKTAVFVGTGFDPHKGHGGKRGEPLRKTPWGEIAYQLGGKEAFAKIAEYDRGMVAPEAEIIREVLPQDTPTLILIDDLAKYIGHPQTGNNAEQLCHFLQHLAEQVHHQNQTVLVVSIPSMASGERNETMQEIQRYRTMLERVGKAILTSSEDETAEIIRRRLFTWSHEALSQDGKVILPDDALETCATYANWTRAHRTQLPGWFPFDQAEQAFKDTYPFHPSLLSVFERKWQSLPYFQQTRGVLCVLALLIASAYKEGYSRVYPDPLIGLGTAPLDDLHFRSAVCMQLGGDERLEDAVMTDICGHNAFAIRLDSRASDEIKHNRLHQKVATTIFFESNGGLAGSHRTEATEPEIRLAVGEPDINIATIEITLEALAEHCYFLTREDKQYRFSLLPNLNKLFADRSSNIGDDRIEEQVKAEIKKLFANSNLVHLFPERPEDIPDCPVLKLVVLAPKYTSHDPQTRDFIDRLTKNYGSSARRFKNSIIWVVSDEYTRLYEEARKVMTWQSIQNRFQGNAAEDFPESSESESTRSHVQVALHIEKAQDALQEFVWQTYKHVALLNKTGEIEFLDLGRIHSGTSSSLAMLIVKQLRLYDYVVDSVSPRFLTRNWPTTFEGQEWSTKAVQDMFFASPLFPRLLNPEILKETIVKGASNGLLGYVGPKIHGEYEPFYYQKDLTISDVAISEERFIITPNMAEEYLSGLDRTLTSLTIDPPQVSLTAGEKMTFTVRALDENGEEIKKKVHWEATGGTIDQFGVFTAGGKDGSDFEVRATVGDQSAWVKVTILSKKPEPPQQFVQSSIQTEARQKPKTAPTHLAWSGEISEQKWKKFYTEVLSRFSANHILKITLQIEILRKEGISLQRIDDLKAALHDLGLNDDVQER